MLSHERARCRVCHQAFCCVPHRRAHEIGKHNKVNPRMPILPLKTEETQVINEFQREATPIPSTSAVISAPMSRKRKHSSSATLPCRSNQITSRSNKITSRKILRPKYRLPLGPILEDEGEFEEHEKKEEETDDIDTKIPEANTPCPESNYISVDQSKEKDEVQIIKEAPFTTSTPITAQICVEVKNGTPNISEVFTPVVTIEKGTPQESKALLKENETPISFIPNSDNQKTIGDTIVRQSRKRKVSFYESRYDSNCYITAIETTDTTTTFFTAPNTQTLSEDGNSLVLSSNETEAKGTGIFSTLANLFRNAFHCLPGEGTSGKTTISHDGSFTMLCSPSGRKRRRAIASPSLGSYLTSLRTNPIKGRPPLRHQHKLLNN